MSWVDDPNLLQILNTGVVFVGLNWSSAHGNMIDIESTPWVSFHSG